MSIPPLAERTIYSSSEVYTDMLNLDSKLSTVGYYRDKYMEGYDSDAMEGALLAVGEGMTIRKAAEAYGVPQL